MPNHIEFESCQKNAPEEVKALDIKEFIETATPYGVDGYVWLVDWELSLATHCSDQAYDQGVGHIYAPTGEWFLAFLRDEKHFEGRRRYPPYK